MRHWCCALERNPEPGLKPVKYRDRVTVEREKYFILLFMPCDVAGYITQIFSTSKWVLWFLCRAVGLVWPLSRGQYRYKGPNGISPNRLVNSADQVKRPDRFDLEFF